MRIRIVSLFITLCMLFLMSVPAFGAQNPNAAADAYQARVEELIGLAGKAARAGDLETAQAYENVLLEMGVVIVVADTASEALDKINGSGETSIAPATVPRPEDTAKVHWYYFTLDRYYYPQRSEFYDLIIIEAICWDDTSEDMHVDYNIVDENNAFDVSGNLGAAATIAIVEFAVGEIPGIGHMFTLRDLLLRTELLETGYDVQEVDANDITIIFSADIGYRFTYVRPNGSSFDHVLACVESKMDAEYIVAGRIRATESNGRVHTTPVSTEKIKVTLKNNDYGNAYKAIDHFLISAVLYDELEQCTITANGEEYEIPSPWLPLTPAHIDA